MASTVLRTQCGFGQDCPEIRVDEPGGPVTITGYRPGTPHTPENEVAIEVPPTLLPEIVSLDLADFDAYLAQVRRTPGDIYRVQTLTQYGVPSDQDFFVRYMDGRPGPTADELRAWDDELDADRAAGRVYRNLHVVDGPLTDYLRYQFEWAYAHNVEHGQDVRIADAAETPAVAALLLTGDYWVLEHEHVVLCRYDDQGRPLGRVRVEASGARGYLAAADLAWRLATPFNAWWTAHPQYHRETTRVA